ncbi:hypothetical protein H6G41_16830 [Tolypothrix sp. FACHB-123]|uniref:hypothetical protein n=1 Tax=Tolypothrix sp. FACHB-123 TaxID=2692868 RepID=UPI0016859330|nr:hypothetical protein [Tolypothrix sp. FACHB-123]MBD2356273.1 hypothetical protein [Tolypothrix sp. FACHB-123]
MKLLFTALAITSTIFWTQGCASVVQSTDNSTSKHHDSAGASNSHEHHGGHSGLESTTIAKLTVPGKLAAQTPVSLVIDVQDKNGQAIANFDKFQEQLMHLIIVGDNLDTFNHIHPTYKGNGRFEVQTSFPHPGNYTLFSDYKPGGKAEEVSLLKAQVPGEAPNTPKIDFSTTNTFGNTLVNLQFSQPTLTAGKEVNVMFNLQDAATKEPIKDLQPYLGEKGHLVIIKRTSQLTRADYIHAHAVKDTPASKVHFLTSFPQPGNYKLWGQFNRNGKVVTAEFWVTVQ